MILTSLQSTNFLVIFRYPADRYKHGHSNSNSKHRLHSQHKRISVVVLSPVRLMAKNHKCMIQNPQTSGSPSRKLNTIFLAPLPITPKISSTSFHAFLGYVASAASIQFYLGEGGRRGATVFLFALVPSPLPGLTSLSCTQNTTGSEQVMTGYKLFFALSRNGKKSENPAF